MHVGIANFNTEYGLRPDEIARALEERVYLNLNDHPTVLTAVAIAF
jgi:hypothetical protein